MNMSKIAPLFEAKKPTKQQPTIYFAAEENKPSLPTNAVENLTIKVYKQLKAKTGGENGPGATDQRLLDW
jgi:hypothetical protein